MDRVSAVPTSVSMAIRTSGSAVMRPGRTKPRQNERTSVCQRANQAARQMMTTIFAISDGWKRPMKGNLIQRFDPSSGAAMPGTKHITSRRQATIYMAGAKRRIRSPLTHAHTPAATRPRTAMTVCLERK
jgi:hypothetical protein